MKTGRKTRGFLAVLLSLCVILAALGGAFAIAEHDAPAEAPALEKAAEKESEQPSEPVRVPAPEKAEEEEEEPAEEKAEAPISASDEEEPTEVAAKQTSFKADVHIELKNKGDIYFGDQVTLAAEVRNANGPYEICWQYFDEEKDNRGENPWIQLGTKAKYSFTVNEENADCVYRVVLEGTVVSETYKLSGVSARPEEPAEEETEEETEETEEEVAEEETEETEEEVAEEETEETEEEVIEEEVTEAEAEEIEEETEETEWETVEEEEPETSLVDALDPDRGVDIYIGWEGDALRFGDSVQMIAVPRGYDNTTYTLQWQTRRGNGEWQDIASANDSTLTRIITEENYLDEWRVVVTVTEAGEASEAE